MKQAIRPRLVIDLQNNDLNWELKKIAVERKVSMRKLVLGSLGASYPTLAEIIRKELN